MKPVKKVQCVKDKLRSSAKVVVGAFVVSGLAIGGATVIDDGGFNSLWDDEVETDDQESETELVDDQTSPMNGSQALNAGDELVNVLSNDTEAEMYHRYGC